MSVSISQKKSSFTFSVFRFVCTAREEIRLPRYAGSTLRGGFGNALKSTVCTNPSRSCDDCLVRDKCVYRYVFTTPLPPDSSVMTKYEHVPRPFVLSPPFADNNVYRRGETLLYKLTLVGRAIEFLPYFIYAVIRLGEGGFGKGRGRFFLESVEDVLDSNRAIYTPDTPRITRRFQRTGLDFTGDFDSFDTRDCSSITLRYLTPLRLVYRGTVEEVPEFHILFRNILRRVRLLSRFHCGGDLAVEHKALISDARKVRIRDSGIRWFSFRRWRKEPERTMRLGGILGRVTYDIPDAAPLERFLPYLRAGQYVHAGKSTTFGLGEYVIEEVS